MSSLASHSPIADRYTCDINGQTNEVNQTLSFALLKRLHKFFRDEAAHDIYQKFSQMYGPTISRKVLNQSMSFILVVSWINNKNETVRVTGFKYPLEIEFQTRRFQNDFF